MIVTLRINPGDQVDENKLIRELFMGRTPIREALFRLVAEDLVHVCPGRGFFVRDVTLCDLKDLFETIVTLERSAVLLAARRIKSEQIDKLKIINDAFKRAGAVSDLSRHNLENSRFHKVIYDAAGNIFLENFLNSLLNQSQRLAFIFSGSHDSDIDMRLYTEHSVKDHEHLILCLKNRDEKEAVRVITEHIRRFQKCVSDFIAPRVINIATAA